MKLRLRLALTVLLLTVPLVVCATLLGGAIRRSHLDEGAVNHFLDRMGDEERNRCEQNAEHWPASYPRRHRHRWRPPRRVFAYDIHFQSRNPRAPPLDAQLRRALSSGDEWAATWSPPKDDPPRRLRAGSARIPYKARQIAVRLSPASGSCAIMTFNVPAHEPSRAALLVLPLVMSALTSLAVLLAAGPIVVRIRRLTRCVDAAEHFDTPVAVEGTDEIAELARAFEQKRKGLKTKIAELEKRDEALKDYLANTTHDVAIPLTVLQGHLHSAQKEVRRSNIATDSLQAAVEESHYIASLVANLSAAAKLDAFGLHPQSVPLNLADLVERVVQRHRPIAEPRGIEVNYAIPDHEVWVEGDVTLLEQAISNLVHNAVQYNYDHGHVAVILRASDRRFELEVSDDGAGIDAEDLPRLTERRFRSRRARARHPSGTGIGLHIVRDVAEAHGFSLDIDAANARGLRVYLRGNSGSERIETRDA
ncbi:MAG: HAMP domain-containing sensor histidine kinase [Myxococcota bacterium]